MLGLGNSCWLRRLAGLGQSRYLPFPNFFKYRLWLCWRINSTSRHASGVSSLFFFASLSFSKTIYVFQQRLHSDQKNQAMQKELCVNNNSSPLPHHRCCYRCWSCLCCCPNPKKRRSFLGVLVLQPLRRMSLAAWAQEYVGGLELLVHVRVHHSWRNHSRNWNRQVSLIASVSPGPLAMGLRWCEMLALFASSLLEDQGKQYVLG